ncbi:MAG: DUF4250 domain-containing protein [Succinivibrio sp.]|jgi:hypothetical protein|nr:DUF4250 domain-containing protein [Succinivibrio sp.]MCI6450489.1 DUF4250 domain-containing protein [Succinivibrio sp.]MDD6067499.1 DUF4250 domain-containing protein [Succinivibrio sp.]MDY4993332.1 DUF4250 domain-containing protein [Succinivibrio sp.]MDY5324999.1 DUF4250 domain-containing protein [Succinivibrio sp.]
MMSLKNYLNMDVYMLLSAVNMQLRDEFESVSSLCSYHEIDEAKLKERLQEAGFTYVKEQNQFK